MSRTESPSMACHPATAIVLWLFFMGWMSVLDERRLLVLIGVEALLLWQSGWREWVRYVRRSRWLLLAIGLVQLWAQPSASGLTEATFSIGRWLSMLAALAILMSRLSREALLSGLLTILMPLRYLGLHPERLAVRIGLTLHYAEHLLQQRVSLAECLRQIEAPLPDADTSLQVILFKRYPIGWRDVRCLALALVLGLGIQFLWP